VARGLGSGFCAHQKVKVKQIPQIGTIICKERLGWSGKIDSVMEEKMKKLDAIAADSRWKCRAIVGCPSGKSSRVTSVTWQPQRYGRWLGMCKRA
jgi:hypothetical protein